MRKIAKPRVLLGTLIAVLALVVLAVVPAMAQVPVFSPFSGSVIIDAANAPVGSELRAYVDGVQAELLAPAVGNVFTLTTAGEYQIVIETDATGKAVTFEVKKAGTTTWLAATSDPAAPVTSYQPQTVDLEAGAGAAVPDISVATSLAFGSVTVDTSSTKTLTISNVGTATLSITNITKSGTDAAQFSVGTYPGTIAAGSSAGVSVTFSPTSAGSKSATLTIASNDPVDPTVSVTLSGTGVTGPTPPTPGETFAWWLYETFIEPLV
jgi:hypothetical protein